MHLIITEKNNTAMRIADILSNGRAKSSKVSQINVYRFDDTAVIGLRGHILSVDFPAEYNNWEKTDLGALVDAPVVSIPTQKGYVNALKKLGKDATTITIATDYDREGEMIGVEALGVLADVVPPDIKVQRVHYSTITPAEIREAFSSPVEVDYNLAASGEVRQKADLSWGSVLTRFFSLSAKRLGKNFLSIGRVQSPTLALIVDREEEIEKFVPTKYWVLEVELDNGVKATHEKGRFDDRNEIEKIASSLNDKARLDSLKKRTKKEKPPVPFSTTEFLRAATTIGFSVSVAMSIAENLYTRGFISYPRTDNMVYPSSLDLRGVLNTLSRTSFKELVEPIISSKLTPTRGKKETTDHPPIYPASPAKRSELSDKEWKIYELVARRFLATLYPPCVIETQTAKFSSGGQVLKATGSHVLDLGWRKPYIYSKLSENPLPEMKEGEEFSVVHVEILEKETKPPSRLSQGALIKQMEELGIGTKSTRHEIIGKLYARGYIHGDPIKPTKLSFSVINTLEKYAPDIAKPDMTQRLEEDMERVALGDVQPEDVLDESRTLLKNALSKLEKSKESISEDLKNGIREDAVVGTCRLCGSPLIIRRSRKGGRFIGCSGYPDCTFTLPLPRNGNIRVMDKVCEKHGIHHLQIYTKGKRPWNIGCPECNYEEWKQSQLKTKTKD